jgi:hypothetical protein
MNPYESPSIAATGSAETATRLTRLATLRFLIGFFGGAGLWSLSFPKEAWDANPLFTPCLLLIGIAASMLKPKGLYFGAAGIYLGQLAFIYVFLPTAGIFPVPLAVLLFATLPAVLGCLLGGAVGWMIKQSPSKRDET